MPRLIRTRFTVTGAASDELATKPGSPAYEAVMALTPSGSVVRSKLVVVTPPLVESVDVPSGVPPSVKVTIPVGFAVPVIEVTVAVNVMAPP